VKICFINIPIAKQMSCEVIQLR